MTINDFFGVEQWIVLCHLFYHMLIVFKNVFRMLNELTIDFALIIFY